MLSLEFTNEAPIDWNNFFLDNGLGIFSQSLEYSNYVSKWVGWEPLFCRVIDEKGKILLQNLVFKYNPGISRIPNFAKSIYKKLKKSYRWSYGPISIHDDATSKFFKNFEKNGDSFYGTTHPFLPISIKNSTKWATSIIDLHQTKEEIQKKFDKNSCKKNIKRSIERGVTIEPINEKNFHEYSSIRNDFRNKTSDTLHQSEELSGFWNSLQPIGFAGFLAKKNDIPIGGLTFSYFNKYLIEVGVARSKLDFEEKLYSQDLIKWKIIEWGIENNMDYFDLAGYDPVPKSEKEIGIMRYKEKWGGKRYDYWIVKNGN